MTALQKYQRLECSGLWRDAPEAQRRDVIVSFRDATLIISDSRSDIPLSHWSLPAVERANPGAMPAIFRPGADSDETLEIDDSDMIGALTTVSAAVEAWQPRPGRMRGWLLGGALLAVAAVLIFWMPGALISHTAQVVPWAKRQQIGHDLLANIEHISGTPCEAAPANRILTKFATRLFGNAAPLIEVMRQLPVSAAHLPGGILLVNHKLIEDHEGPDVLAGYLLAEAARARDEDPLLPLLRWAGLRASFTLLTTGNLPDGAMKGYGEALLSRTPIPVTASELAPIFRAAGVPSTPYAKAAAPAEGDLDPLVTDDPFAKGPEPQPLMSDDDWVALQGICVR
ncbi:hypothetical protein [Solirhodobacter olei]|uniref:hypothetical protein n=1 Tax=Solirhodobacter olei TaxID=2493082 RepID=UPI000FDC3762|nr:hypothetical protein [Solirhodobacter olei]